MARSQAERDTAFAAGKLAAEDAFADEDDPARHFAFYGLRSAEIPDDLQDHFKEGWSFASMNIGLANYVPCNEITRARVKRLVEGRHQIEETPAQIVVAPMTVTRIERLLAKWPEKNTDEIINRALDWLEDQVS